MQYVSMIFKIYKTIVSVVSMLFTEAFLKGKELTQILKNIPKKKPLILCIKVIGRMSVCFSFCPARYRKRLEQLFHNVHWRQVFSYYVTPPLSFDTWFINTTILRVLCTKVTGCLSFCLCILATISIFIKKKDS